MKSKFAITKKEKKSFQNGLKTNECNCGGIEGEDWSHEIWCNKQDKICKCGHSEIKHHLIERRRTWCYDCECIEFTLKEKQK